MTIACLNYGLFFVFCFLKTGSPHIPSCPGTHYIDQAGLTLNLQRSTHPASPTPSAQTKDVQHHTWLWCF